MERLSVVFCHQLTTLRKPSPTLCMKKNLRVLRRNLKKGTKENKEFLFSHLKRCQRFRRAGLSRALRNTSSVIQSWLKVYMHSSWASMAFNLGL